MARNPIGPQTAIRLYPQQQQQLKLLATRWNLSVAEVVRRMVQEKLEELQNTTKIFANVVEVVPEADAPKVDVKVEMEEICIDSILDELL